METKPREFWLDIATPYGDPCDFISTQDPYKVAAENGTHPCVSATNIHVIEYSAYQSALDRIKTMERQEHYNEIMLKNKDEIIESYERKIMKLIGDER